MKSQGGINKLINARKGIVVFGTSFIQVSVVNTHSSLFISLFDKYYIHEPFKEMNFANELGFNEVGDFFMHGSRSLWGETTLLLFDRVIGQGHIKFVSFYFRIDS